jgi:hypothetical protein
VVFHVEVVDTAGRTGLAQHDADILAVRDELTGDVGAEESARPDDQFHQ